MARRKKNLWYIHLMIGTILLFAVIVLSLFVSYVPVQVDKPAPKDIYARKTAVFIDKDAIKLMEAEMYNSILPPRYRIVAAVQLFFARVNMLSTLMSYQDFSPGDVLRYEDVFGKENSRELVNLLLKVEPDDYPIVSELIHRVSTRIINNGIVSTDMVDVIIEKALNDEGVFSEYREIVGRVVHILIPGITDEIDIDYVENKMVFYSLNFVSPVRLVVKGDLVVEKGQIVTPSAIYILNAVGYITDNLWTKLAETFLFVVFIAWGVYGLYLWRGHRYGKLIFSIPYVVAIWYILFFVMMWYFPYDRVGFWVSLLLGLVLMYAIMGTRITVATSVAVLALIIWRFSVPTVLIASAMLLIFVTVYPFRLVRMGKYMFTVMMFLMIYSGLSTGIASYGILGDLKAALVEGGITALLVPISVVIVFLLIPLLEHRWHIITPINLIRLMQPTNPLLKRLSVEAPGTYQHSYAVAILCQKAADAIGADSLLTYVGALYHDMGKLYHPDYFIENLKPGIVNPHEETSPYVSAQRIKAHVKEGVKLIRKYKLPRVLEDFVTTHHGTTLIKFFYKKAKALGEDIYEKDFRYDGPLPVSKETTILMLADSIEAAVRSMVDHSRDAICAKVEEIFKDRLEDGQLVNSRLSFAEMDRIKEVFCDVLMDMYHGRIRYDNVEEIYGRRSKRRKKGT